MLKATYYMYCSLLSIQFCSSTTESTEFANFAIFWMPFENGVLIAYLLSLSFFLLNICIKYVLLESLQYMLY